MSESLAIIHLLHEIFATLAVLYIVQLRDICAEPRRRRRSRRSRTKQDEISTSFCSSCRVDPNVHQYQDSDDRWTNGSTSSASNIVADLAADNCKAKARYQDTILPMHHRSFYEYRRPGLRGGGGSQDDEQNGEDGQSEALSSMVCREYRPPVCGQRPVARQGQGPVEEKHEADRRSLVADSGCRRGYSLFDFAEHTPKQNERKKGKDKNKNKNNKKSKGQGQGKGKHE